MTNIKPAVICQDRKGHITTDAQLIALGQWMKDAKPGDVFICPTCGKPHTRIVTAPVATPVAESA